MANKKTVIEFSAEDIEAILTDFAVRMRDEEEPIPERPTTGVLYSIAGRMDSRTGTASGPLDHVAVRVELLANE